MTVCGNVSELMSLDEDRFEHHEPGSSNEKPERDFMEIEDTVDVDRKISFSYYEVKNSCEKRKYEPLDVDPSENLETTSLIDGEEKENIDSYGQNKIPGTRIPTNSQDYEGLDYGDKIRMKEKFEKEKQEPIKEDNNEALEKANLTNDDANLSLNNNEKPKLEPIKEDNNGVLEKAHLTNDDANPSLNNNEKPKLGTPEKENTGNRQTKGRGKLTKDFSAKHGKLKDKQKKAKNKGKTDTRSVIKQGLNKNIFNQVNAITKSNNSHCGSYIPRKKLNNSGRLGILLLAMLCIVHISEEAPVTWNLRGLVYFGKTAILDCILNVTSNICHDDTVTRRWSKHGHNTTSVISINGYSSNNSKYEEQVNKQCTVSSLIIKNFDQSDIADYTCGFGLMEYSKELKLEIDSFRSYPAKENINGGLLCSQSNLRLDLQMRNIFPRPKCYSEIENDGVQHKITRTDLSGVLYNTEDMVEFLLKDRSCSGIIHTFCSFEETKKEVFNSTYDCCSDSKPSLALKVSMSFLSVTTFAVVMCFVCFCKRKKKGGIQCFYLRRADSSGSDQPLARASASVEND